MISPQMARYNRLKDCPVQKLRQKSWRLKTRYGITLEDLYKMEVAQNNRCAICGKETKLHVDHCHSTGKVRGLLCFPCNNGLGNFKDNRNLLLNAADYLNQ